MGQLSRLAEARQEVRAAAMRRWRERQPEREKNLHEINTAGAGAADSPNRRARYQLREAAFEAARNLRATGRLPLGLERRIGPTLDWTPFAPSDGARKAGRPVARVVMLGGPGSQPEGFATCFLVTPRLLLTNHHVFPSKADAAGTGANFLFERDEQGLKSGVTFEIDADAFYLSEEKLDLALVAVKQTSLDGKSIADFGTVPLVEATPKILIGHRINIIQHPQGGEKKYAITENRLVDLLDTGFLHYETDTDEGSSGSPIFSQDWQLVGLHHSSIPEMRDGKVVTVDRGVWDRSMPDNRVHWIANEGIRVSSIVKYLGSAKMEDPAKNALLGDLMATTTDPVDDLMKEMAKTGDGGRATGGGGLPGGSALAGNQFTFSGPVTIHVHAAPAAPAVAPAPPARTIDVTPSVPVALEKAIRFDPKYKERKGYDPNFLDDNPKFTVPVPSVRPSREGELLKRGGKPHVLKYHHYELVMNEARYLQMWSAVNVDYNPELKHKGDRKSFGSDKWIADPRIPGELQIQDAEFYKPAGNIDRGHMVRREDNAWGETAEEIEFANSDTFHWTNCTPQHEAFNQSTPGRNDATYRGMSGLWGDFENHVQKSLNGKDTRACILAGPVLSSKDPSKDFGFGEIQYPLQFWKVVAVPIAPDGARRLTVYGFVLSQADVVKKFGIEVFRPGRFKKFQVSLASITKLTDVVFDQSLHRADVLAGETGELPIGDGNEALKTHGLAKSSDGAAAATVAMLAKTTTSKKRSKA